MAPEFRVLDTPSESKTIETAHQLLELAQVAKLSAWIEPELKQLEETFVRFTFRRQTLFQVRSA
jgi:hypothetical protein